MIVKIGLAVSLLLNAYSIFLGLSNLETINWLTSDRYEAAKVVDQQIAPLAKRVMILENLDKIRTEITK